MDQSLSLISKYRDRFSAWGLVIGFLSLIVAVWTRAPGLEVQIPFVGGAQVGLNVGYVMMAGMILLALSMAWLIGPLLAMRRIQQAVLEELESGKATLSAPERREFLGAIALDTSDGPWAKGVYRLATGIRYFVFFICPVLSIVGFIGNSYFLELEAIDKKQLTEYVLNHSKNSQGHLTITGFPPELKERITFIEYFLKSKPQNSNGEQLNDFVVEDSKMEKRCIQIWVRDFLQSKNKLLKGERKLLKNMKDVTGDEKCVFDDFPQYELAVNSWLNLIAVGLSVWIATIGWRLYFNKEITAQLDSIEKSYRNHIDKKRRNVSSANYLVKITSGKD